MGRRRRHARLGRARRLAPLADLYRQADAAQGHDPSALRISVNSHGYVADSARGAVDDTYPYLMTAMQTFLRAPAAALPSRGQYEAETAINGALVAGSPEQVAEKIVYQHKTFRSRPVPDADQPRYRAPR
jgi:alkanesulfonate monooxygenase SsuD/methylene tetrahydromethanopterin reductase-like flavin-dependent oxidoreductase (luciferase family)